MNYNSSINQEIKQKLVNREVEYCISYLVSELAQDEKYMEELFPVLQKEDWEGSALYFLESITQDQCSNFINSCMFTGSNFGLGSLKGLKRIIKSHLDNNCQEFCEFFDIDPEITEAYEHWIVSDWLAGKLEAKGAMVINDFMGLTIWGRTCSGQAILLDNVISKICSDMEILEGQKHSWAPIPVNTEAGSIKRLRQVRDSLNKCKNSETIEQIARLLNI